MDQEELDALQKMVTVAAGEVETRLADSLKEAIGGINSKLDINTVAAAEIQGSAKAALEAVPHLIQEHVETQLKVNLTGIVEEVGKQFEDKVKAMAGGNSGAAGGMSLRELLGQSDKIISVVNAWRQPTTEAAMLTQMNFVMKWHALLSKLEKGGGSGEEFTKAIASTFATEKQE